MQVLRERIREEIRQKYEAKEVFDAIEEFLVKQSQLTSTKALAFEQRIADRTAELARKDAQLGAVAINLYRLKNQYLLLYKVMEAKCVHLVESMIYALNKEDYLLLALCARSLVEHAAFLSYLVQEAKTEDIEALYILYGKSLYSTQYFGQEGLVDVIDLLNMVEERLPADGNYIKECYDSLADFVHPAFSSNVMIFDELAGEEMIGPSVEQKKAAIEKVLRTVGTAIGYLDNKAEAFASVGMTVESHLQKTLKTGAMPERLVDERPAPAKKPIERPKPPGEEPGLRRGPFGGAIFFNRKGKTWLKY